MDTHNHPNNLQTTDSHRHRHRHHHVQLSSSQDNNRNTTTTTNNLADKHTCNFSLATSGVDSGRSTTTTPPQPPPQPTLAVEETGRERLKKHRVEMAGRVWIPDMWGQEDLLKDWVDCSVFDSSLENKSIMSARTALVQAARSTVRIENRC